METPVPQLQPVNAPLSPQEVSLGAPDVEQIAQMPVSSMPPPRVQPIPTYPVSGMKPRRNPIWIVMVIVIILGIAGSAGAYWYLTDKGEPLIIEDQPVSDVIHVKKLRLEKDGFLVISLINFSAGHFRVTATVRLVPDTYTDFDLEVTNFSEDVELRPGAKLFGTVVYDTNANGQIDEEEEFAPASINGKPIRQEFKILAR